ncbi:MAG: acetyl-CoA carboxylase biotin carboxyl carrier protein subunit [Anaerolineae bacterium]|nr:acetyl-CoA carboxylase biotin carboxyl carrier protein subunit [Anaerolineae bacterium]
MKYVVEVEGRQYRIDVEGGRIAVDGEWLELDVKQIGDLPLYSLLVDSASVEVSVEEESRFHYSVMLAGEMYSVTVRPEGLSGASEGGRGRRTDEVVRAPMPGLVASLPVSVGQQVRLGQTLVVVESMKMENPLQAPAAGVVTQIHVGPGDSVEKNQPIVTLKFDGAAAGEGRPDSDGGSEDG